MGRVKYPAELWEEFYAVQRKSWTFVVPMILALAFGGITQPTFKHFGSDWVLLAVLVLLIATAWIFWLRYFRALMAVWRRMRAYSRASRTP